MWCSESSSCTPLLQQVQQEEPGAAVRLRTAAQRFHAAGRHVCPCCQQLLQHSWHIHPLPRKRSTAASRPAQQPAQLLLPHLQAEAGVCAGAQQHSSHLCMPQLRCHAQRRHRRREQKGIALVRAQAWYDEGGQVEGLSRSGERLLPSSDGATRRHQQADGRCVARRSRGVVEAHRQALRVTSRQL
jgi:hypothetical protein